MTNPDPTDDEVIRSVIGGEPDERVDELVQRLIGYDG